MLKVASVILSIWSGINSFLGAAVLALVVGFKKNAPLLYIVFEESEIPALDHRVISAANALAILFNASVAAFSLLSLFVIWSGLVNAQRWAFWAPLITVGLVQVFGFAADSAIGNKTLYVNITLSALYLLGMALAAVAVFK